jgi:surface protein
MRNKFVNFLLNSFNPNRSAELKTNRTKIIAEDKEHLFSLIKLEIKLNGNNCDLNHIDISIITDLTNLFKNSKFNGDISQWNTSNVKCMHSMFKESEFTGDISQWDTSKVTIMCEMFCDSRFNGDISQWNTSSVVNTGFMFQRSIFNGDISDWDVSNVKKMDSMFYGSMFNGDISKWNVSNVDNMLQMFTLSTFTKDLSNWTPYKLYDNQMFLYCNAPIPYWANIENQEERTKAINAYQLDKELSNNNIKPIKKLKL